MGLFSHNREVFRRREKPCFRVGVEIKVEKGRNHPIRRFLHSICKIRVGKEEGLSTKAPSVELIKIHRPDDDHWE